MNLREMMDIYYEDGLTRELAVQGYARILYSKQYRKVL